MTAKTMAEVMAEHRQPNWRADHLGWDCKCGHVLTREYPSMFPLAEHEAHVAAALSAAGYGLVADAKREALEEAADDAALRLAGHSGISITRLRARAAEMRQRDAES